MSALIFRSLVVAILIGIMHPACKRRRSGRASRIGTNRLTQAESTGNSFCKGIATLRATRSCDECTT
jgi:hypothetical protein